MWHIKDMDKITRDYTELGNGSIDMFPCCLIQWRQVRVLLY